MDALGAEGTDAVGEGGQQRPSAQTFGHLTSSAGEVSGDDVRAGHEGPTHDVSAIRQHRRNLRRAVLRELFVWTIVCAVGFVGGLLVFARGSRTVETTAFGVEVEEYGRLSSLGLAVALFSVSVFFGRGTLKSILDVLRGRSGWSGILFFQQNVVALGISILALVGAGVSVVWAIRGDMSRVSSFVEAGSDDSEQDAEPVEAVPSTVPPTQPLPAVDLAPGWKRFVVTSSSSSSSDIQLLEAALPYTALQMYGVEDLEADAEDTRLVVTAPPSVSISVVDDLLQQMNALTLRPALSVLPVTDPTMLEQVPDAFLCKGGPQPTPPLSETSVVSNCRSGETDAVYQVGPAFLLGDSFDDTQITTEETGGGEARNVRVYLTTEAQQNAASTWRQCPAMAADCPMGTLALTVGRWVLAAPGVQTGTVPEYLVVGGATIEDAESIAALLRLAFVPRSFEVVEVT